MKCKCPRIIMQRKFFLNMKQRRINIIIRSNYNATSDWLLPQHNFCMKKPCNYLFIPISRKLFLTVYKCLSKAYLRIYCNLYMKLGIIVFVNKTEKNKPNFITIIACSSHVFTNSVSTNFKTSTCYFYLILK